MIDKWTLSNDISLITHEFDVFDLENETEMEYCKRNSPNGEIVCIYLSDKSIIGYAHLTYMNKRNGNLELYYYKENPPINLVVESAMMTMKMFESRNDIKYIHMFMGDRMDWILIE